MKKAIYEAPQVEILRFETEDVLANLVPSGTGDSPEVGGITFGGGSGPISVF